MSQLGSLATANELLKRSSKDKNFLATHKASTDKIKLAVTNAEKATTPDAAQTNIKTVSAELKKLDDAAKNLAAEKAALKTYRKSVESIEALVLKHSASLSPSASHSEESAGKAPKNPTVPQTSTKPTPPPRPTNPAPPQRPANIPPQRPTSAAPQKVASPGNAANAAKPQQQPPRPQPNLQPASAAPTAVSAFISVLDRCSRFLENQKNHVPLALKEVKAAMQGKDQANTAIFQAALNELKGYEPDVKTSTDAVSAILALKAVEPAKFKSAVLKRAPQLQAAVAWQLPKTEAATKVSGSNLIQGMAAFENAVSLHGLHVEFRTALVEVQKIL